MTLAEEIEAWLMKAQCDNHIDPSCPMASKLYDIARRVGEMEHTLDDAPQSLCVSCGNYLENIR